MKDSATRRFETFIGVREFCIALADNFPANSRGGEVKAILDAIITEMEGHAATQSSGTRAAREVTTLKAVRRAALHEDLEAINRTARALSLTTPGLDDKFRLPRNLGDQAWLAAARSFATDAESIKAEFIRRGLPADFLDDLNADITAFEESIGSREQKSGERIAATASIDGAIERGMNAVRELDAIVQNIFRNDPAILARWTSAKHTERAPRHPAAAQPPPTTPTPPKQ
jgi:hypothetical protein